MNTDDLAACLFAYTRRASFIEGFACQCHVLAAPARKPFPVAAERYAFQLLYV